MYNTFALQKNHRPGPGRFLAALHDQCFRLGELLPEARLAQGPKGHGLLSWRRCWHLKIELNILAFLMFFEDRLFVICVYDLARWQYLPGFVLYGSYCVKWCWCSREGVQSFKVWKPEQRQTCWLLTASYSKGPIRLQNRLSNCFSIRQLEFG